jgi:hypothetical protein
VRLTVNGYELPVVGPARPVPLAIAREPLTLPDVPAHLKELDHCVDKLAMKGLLQDTNPGREVPVRSEAPSGVLAGGAW